MKEGQQLSLGGEVPSVNGREIKRDRENAHHEERRLKKNEFGKNLLPTQGLKRIADNGIPAVSREEQRIVIEPHKDDLDDNVTDILPGSAQFAIARADAKRKKAS